MTMVICRGRESTEKIRDSYEVDSFSNDAFIVFLDAASDGDFDALRRSYEQAGNRKQSLMDRGQPTLQM